MFESWKRPFANTIFFLKQNESREYHTSCLIINTDISLGSNESGIHNKIPSRAGVNG
jgi:hypothetical protein